MMFGGILKAGGDIVSNLKDPFSNRVHRCSPWFISTPKKVGLPSHGLQLPVRQGPPQPFKGSEPEPGQPPW